MNNKIAAGACCAALVLGAGVYFGGVIMTKHQADRMIPTALENANRQLDTKGTGLRIDYERLSDGLMSEKAKRYLRKSKQFDFLTSRTMFSSRCSMPVLSCF